MATSVIKSNETHPAPPICSPPLLLSWFTGCCGDITTSAHISELTDKKPCRLGQNQVVLLDTPEQEISKCRECNSILDINALKRALKLQQKNRRKT
ncbi:overexpressed in colon carcinoma 1 protein isoform X1 [Phyllobates terribilis]|uniref:overexpressed in colon carcinoma 1 protein isoform X1 n=1 Tax=Phyllobates terribilis TaxID=111132 RepID=UPI003CCA6F44